MDDTRTIGGGRIMTSWAARMHSLGTVVTSCGHPTAPYPRRIDKVKFGAPLDEVCKNDIPGPLLILILKLNKEAPYKKDVFRAPGHQGSMKKLIHFLQNGRLVNIDNFSVYTIASVLKKFLRKIPDGIFGRDGEALLFQIIDMTSIEDQRDHVHSLISSLPIFTQRLVVLLFGTFRVVASNCERAETGMTSEALGVSVAPSFFQSCVSDGKQAKMEDVMKFKVATKIMKFLIDNFGVSNLFGRDNYEYYARITGRILRVEEDWIFSFRYPPDALVSHEHPHPSEHEHERYSFISPIFSQMSLEAEKGWLEYESERWGLKFNLEAMSHQEECHSTPALLQTDYGDGGGGGGSLDPSVEPSTSFNSIPENNHLLESYNRLSISLEDNNGLFTGVSVHERQAARMKTRSEWFLSPGICTGMSCVDVDGSLGSSHPFYILREDCVTRNIVSSPDPPGTHALVRRTSSKDKEHGRHRLVRRSSSKKNKENGSTASTPTPTHSNSHSNSSSSGCGGSRKSGGPTSGGSTPNNEGGPPPAPQSSVDKVLTSTQGPCDLGGQSQPEPGPESVLEPQATASSLMESRDCTETDVQTFHVTLTYKPRI